MLSVMGSITRYVRRSLLALLLALSCAPAASERALSLPGERAVVESSSPGEPPPWVRTHLDALELAGADNARDRPRDVPNLVVTRDRVLLDGDEVCDLTSLPSGNGRIEPLFERLANETKARSEPHTEIVYWIDQRIRAEVVKRVLRTAAQAGFVRGKLAVRSRHQGDHFGVLPADVQGPRPLTAGEISEALRAHHGALRDCYEAEVARRGTGASRSLSGTLVVSFGVEPDGSVSAVKVGPGSTLDDAAIVRCVLAELERIQFPESNGSGTTVNYPLLFFPR